MENQVKVTARREFNQQKSDPEIRDNGIFKSYQKYIQEFKKHNDEIVNRNKAMKTTTKRTK